MAEVKSGYVGQRASHTRRTSLDTRLYTESNNLSYTRLVALDTNIAIQPGLLGDNEGHEVRKASIE